MSRAARRCTTAAEESCTTGLVTVCRTPIHSLKSYLKIKNKVRWTRKTGQLVKWESCS